MAAQFYSGSFTKKATTGTQAITGVGFTPKAIIFWSSGSAAASGTWYSALREAIGFTDGTTSYAVAGSSRNNVASSKTDRRIANKAITITNELAGVLAEADLSSMDSDGFTLNWTTAEATAQTICFMAIGGEGVSAKVVNWTSPTSTGNKAVSGIGFQPDTVLHIGASRATVGTQVDIRTGFGAMDASGGQWTNSLYAADSVTASTRRYQRTDKCISIITTSVQEEASFVSMDAGGFTINFSSVSTLAFMYASLCLKGVQAKALSFNKTTTLDRIDTSTSATATAYSNQRKIDRCQNGVLWEVHQSTDPGGAVIGELFYSTNDGATWTRDDNKYIENGSGAAPGAYTANISFFIDLDDFAHVVFKDSNNGFIYYRRGAPNAGRTSWTWSSAHLVTTSTDVNHPDLVAFRTPGSSPTTWEVCIVASVATAAPVNYAQYERIRIANNGAPTSDNFDGLTGSFGMSRLNDTSYNVNVHTFPSIDFNHTGDGKTVAGGTPHLYATWSAGATGAGKGIRFRKSVYSAGPTWTWNDEREIDSGRYIANDTNWLVCMFDGTRVIMPGFVTDASFNFDVILHERNVADDATTPRVLLEDTSTVNRMTNGSATFDSQGNVYLFGRSSDGVDGTQKLSYRKWTRTGESLGGLVTFDPTGSTAPRITVKRGYSDNRIEFIYTDGTSSPYDVKYVGIDATTEQIYQGINQSVTGIGFTPKALLMSSAQTTASASVNTNARWALGAYDGVRQRVVGQFDQNTANPTNAKSLFENTNVIIGQMDASIPSANAIASVASFDAAGFTINWSANETTATEILYLALASLPREGWGTVHI